MERGEVTEQEDGICSKAIRKPQQGRGSYGRFFELGSYIILSLGGESILLLLQTFAKVNFDNFQRTKRKKQPAVVVLEKKD